MTPQRLRDVLGMLRWPSHVLADVLNVSDRTVGRWMAGKGPIPVPVAAWCEELGQVVERATLVQVIERAPRAPDRSTDAWEDRT